jgi:hypothetical protein
MAHATVKFNVVAVAPSGATKVIAAEVGALRATKLAAEIKARGFAVRVEEVGTVAVTVGTILGVRD